MLDQLSDVSVDVEYLPASLHNRPSLIPDRVRKALDGALYSSVSLGYADCGTGGLLDAIIAEMALSGRHLTRLPGAHCYEFFTGAADFAALHEAEPGTFFLTDFLVRQFDQLVMVGLGLDKHPELRDTYFGNYTRVVLITQTPGDNLVKMGRKAAAQLGLAFEHRHVGLVPFNEVFIDSIRPRVSTATETTV